MPHNKPLVIMRVEIVPPTGMRDHEIAMNLYNLLKREGYAKVCPCY